MIHIPSIPSSPAWLQVSRVLRIPEDSEVEEDEDDGIKIVMVRSQ